MMTAHEPSAGNSSLSPAGDSAPNSSPHSAPDPTVDPAAQLPTDSRDADRASPHRSAIADLPVFDRLDLPSITLVNTLAQALAAQDALMQEAVWGFDTESKPTFRVGEVSDGPHVVQLSTLRHAWVFQLHDAACRAIAAELLAAPGIAKVGFGLRDDTARIRKKLGIEPLGIVDLNTLFRARGYRKELGVKAAVAELFGRRFLKSKKAATSNWASPSLTHAQLIYAANDAYAAIRVYTALTHGAAA